MRLRAALLLGVCASWLIVPAQMSAQIMQAYATSGTAPVAPGVVHESGTASASAGEQQVHILTVAPDSPDLRFETSLPFDKVSARERVTDQALRQSTEGHRVIAAVNANLWSTWGDFALGTLAYSPIGLAISDGELVTAPSGAWPSFGIHSGGFPAVGQPTVTVQVTLPSGATAAVNEVNRHRDPEEMILYTPRFDTHTWTDALGVEVILEADALPLSPMGTLEATVAEVRQDVGDAPIGPTQLVLSASGAQAETLRYLLPGDRLTVTTSIDGSWADVTEAIGGAEILVEGGALQTYSWRRPDAVLKPHPRTAIGVRADGGVVLVAVDGRSSVSRGLTNAEMGELLLSLGAVSALNLDGGGSTTMAVRQPGDVEVSVVNRPSDGVERTVSTSLQLVSSAATGELSDVVISTGAPNVYVDETHQLVAKGRDASHNGIVLDQSVASWTGTGDAASVTPEGVLHATSVGPVELGLTYGEFSTTRAIQIFRDGAPPILTLPSAVMAHDPQAGISSMGLTVSWGAWDVAGVVVSTQLQQRVNTGSWRGVTLATPTSNSARRAAKFGSRYQFRVRATDDSGNRSDWTYGPVYRVDSFEAPSAVMPPTGPWATTVTRYAIGRQFARSDARIAPQIGAAGAFTGVQAALIGVRAKKGGLATIYYDGVDVGTVDTFRPTKQMRTLLFMTPIRDADQSTQQHWLEIRNVSGALRPFVDLDAVLVLVAEQPSV